MAKKVAYFTKLDPEIREAMRRFKEDTGVPEAQQIERALREWLGGRTGARLLPKPSTRKAAPRRKR